jgi:hypothetical protein
MSDKKPKWSEDDERSIDTLVDIIIDSYLAMTLEQRKKWHEKHGGLPNKQNNEK